MKYFTVVADADSQLRSRPSTPAQGSPVVRKSAAAFVASHNWSGNATAVMQNALQVALASACMSWERKSRMETGSQKAY